MVMKYFVKMVDFRIIICFMLVQPKMKLLKYWRGYWFNMVSTKKVKKKERIWKREMLLGCKEITVI